MIILILIILFWLACAVGSWGLWIAQFQSKYYNLGEYREDLGEGLLFGLMLGPLEHGIQKIMVKLTV